MKQLNFADRKMIERLRRDELGIRAVGRAMNKPHNTISDEIRKNKMEYEEYYDAEQAQARHERRQMNKGNKKKLERKIKLKEHIIKKLRNDWSPEQVAGELNTRCGMTVISHETIYQFIYSEEGRSLKLWLHLRRKHRPKRTNRGVRKNRKGHILTERVSIHKRPKEVEEKIRIGDLETDSMIFSKQRSILSVQVDRVSMKCALTKLKNKTAEETEYALRRALEDEYRLAYIHTITFDNGSENVRHIQIRDEYEIETYFCDPYSSWQKGLVENINGLIRQYLPRNTNIEELTQDDIYEVQEILNNRPRKSLGYQTPNQFYANLIESGRF